MTPRLYSLLLILMTGFSRCTNSDRVAQSPLTGTYQLRSDVNAWVTAPNQDPITLPSGYEVLWEVEPGAGTSRMQLTSQHGQLYQATLSGQAFTLDTLRFGSNPNKPELCVGKGYFRGDSLFFVETQYRAGTPYNYVVVIAHEGRRIN